MKKSNMKKSKNKVILTSITMMVVVVMICLLFIPLFGGLKFGLDLQGGFEILYKVESIDGSKMNNSNI